MKTTRPANRRNFLLAAGLGGATVAAAVATASGSKRGEKTAPATDQPTGYRATEHILKYYSTTKV